MNKIFLLLAACSTFCGFEKLDSKYWIQYGNPEAESQAIEYFSFSCPQCLEFFQKDFPAIREEYIDSGALHWAFHPDPADLTTLQAMICMSRLKPEHKALFLEAIMDHLGKMKSNEQGGLLMQAAMEVFRDPIPALEDLDFIQKTQAFQDAYAFVAQEDVVKVIPSLEIDGHLYKEYPSKALIDAHMHNQKRPS